MDEETLLPMLQNMARAVFEHGRQTALHDIAHDQMMVAAEVATEHLNAMANLLLPPHDPKEVN